MLSLGDRKGTTTMRKVEATMVKAIEDRKSKRVGHDEVVVSYPVAEWRYRGNLVAFYSYPDDRLVLSDAGWKTTTTKSRLNAAAHGLGWNMFHLWQADWDWFWNVKGDDKVRWPGTLRLYTTDK